MLIQITSTLCINSAHIILVREVGKDIHIYFVNTGFPTKIYNMTLEEFQLKLKGKNVS